jgi:hypothetical protein
LSIVVTGIGLATAAICLPFLIPLLRLFRVDGSVYDEAFVTRAAGPLYVCLVFGIAAMVILLMLLLDIRRGQVFTLANVRRLRLISYCGFAIMAACIVAAIIAVPRPLFIIVAAIAGLMGLLMRVGVRR